MIIKNIVFYGSSGKLEAKYLRTNYSRSIALILHPNFLYGGNINNLIVYNTFHLFAKRGFSVLRFNYRGISNSFCSDNYRIDELSDASAALDWLQKQNFNFTNCWIIGVSYGSFLANQLSIRRPEISNCIIISPPSIYYDLDHFNYFNSYNFIIQGTRDIISKEYYHGNFDNTLFISHRYFIDHIYIYGADHCFNNYMNEFITRLYNYIGFYI